jgi:cardiolipin synthase
MVDLNILGPAGVIWLVVDWVIRIGALFVVPRNRKPSSGTAWLLFIFLFPLLGLLLFVVLGSPKLPKARRQAQKNLDKAIAKTLQQFRRNHDSQQLLTAQAPRKYQSLAALSEGLSHFPVFAGNKLQLLPQYEDVMDKLVVDINAAKHYVHVEYFIIILDDLTTPVFDAMARAVRRGVVVRVLYDSFATKRLKPSKQTLERLKSDGVLAQPMLPFRLGKGYVRPDLRNHRKLVVVDGHTAYTGSLNLVRRNYHRKDSIYYDELVVRVQGPVALQLAAVFVTDWHSETGKLIDYKTVGKKPPVIKGYGSSLAQVLPSGPGYPDENNLKLFTGLIHAAQKRIVITNPYFVPDDALTTAITSAAHRGVEVVMINSEVMDQWMVGHAQRSFYEVLLQAGVKIYWYKAPVLLHSKFMIVDDEISTIGSSNFDIRSFTLNLEVTLISYDPKVAKALGDVAATYLTRSKRVTLAQWQKRPRRTELLDNIARLTAALQ